VQRTAGGSERTRQMLSLAVNIAVVVMELIGMSMEFKRNGFSMIQYYTVDSNILALLGCALCAGFAAVNLFRGQTGLPRWVKTAKYMAACCLAVTFVVVMLILAPQEGPDGFRLMMLSDSMLYHHLLCPVLVILSYLLLEKEPRLGRPAMMIALVPTLVYAVAAIGLNLAKVLVGPYPFLHVYEQPVFMSVVWFALILGGAYLLAWLLWLPQRAKTA